MSTPRIFLACVTTAFALDCARAADFDGDGFDDLAIGAPGDAVGGIAGAGSVHVIYGGPQGVEFLDAARVENWSLASFGTWATPSVGAGFGWSLTTGDFDGDSFDDLAIAAPGAPVKGLAGAGVVVVIYGSAGGLDAARAQPWHQNRKGVADKVEKYAPVPTTSDEGFGDAVAAGDFDGDGRDDLAITVMETFGKNSDRSGAVHVLRGGKKGLTAKRDQFWHQKSKGMPGTLGAGDEFGAALATGDLDGDGIDELVIGAPFAGEDSGSVTILRGTKKKGLRTKGSRVLLPSDFLSVPAAPDEDPHRFGATLVAGDFAGIGRCELAIGTPRLEVFGVDGAGGVFVGRFVLGSFALEDFRVWTRASSSVFGDPIENARFGDALCPADLNGDGRDDLVVGVPSDRIDDVAAGSVTILFGSASGLSATGDLMLHQNTIGAPDQNEASDRFGDALAAADFDGDGADDLVVGAPGEAGFGGSSAGAVLIAPSTALGLSLDAAETLWLIATTGALSSPNGAGSGDVFGFALR